MSGERFEAWSEGGHPPMEDPSHRDEVQELRRGHVIAAPRQVGDSSPGMLATAPQSPGSAARRLAGYCAPPCRATWLACASKLTSHPRGSAQDGRGRERRALVLAGP